MVVILIQCVYHRFLVYSKREFFVSKIFYRKKVLSYGRKIRLVSFRLIFYSSEKKILFSKRKKERENMNSCSDFECEWRMIFSVIPFSDVKINRKVNLYVEHIFPQLFYGSHNENLMYFSFVFESQVLFISMHFVYFGFFIVRCYWHEWMSGAFFSVLAKYNPPLILKLMCAII